MASGKKNYFRHSFFARNDIKLRLLRDRIGVGFYFYFFTLLEQCGESSSEQLQENYTFHDSIIRNLWCVNLKKSERVANEMYAVGLLFFEKRQNTFYFEIPNLAKYLGRYETKNTPKFLSKEKESKVNKSKLNKSVQYTFDDVQKLYLEIFGATHTKQTLMPSKKMIDDFSESINFIKSLDDWRETFTLVKQIPFLMGENKSNWKASLAWLLNYDNYLKANSYGTVQDLEKAEATFLNNLKRYEKEWNDKQR